MGRKIHGGRIICHKNSLLHRLIDSFNERKASIISMKAMSFLRVLIIYVQSDNTGVLLSESLSYRLLG